MKGIFLICVIEAMYFLTLSSLKATIEKKTDKEWAYKLLGGFVLLVSYIILVE